MYNRITELSQDQDIIICSLVLEHGDNCQSVNDMVAKKSSRFLFEKALTHSKLGEEKLLRANKGLRDGKVIGDEKLRR